MIYLKTREEIELCRAAALTVSRTLGLIAREIKEGVQLSYLDKIAEEYIRDNGGLPAFKGYSGFPATLCISMNQAVVHGIPNNTVIKDGDLVSVDCGVKLNGYHGDHAYTFCIGNVAPDVLKLVEVTKESLMLGIEACKINGHIGDISFAVQNHAEKNGYGVVRELVGHGLGKKLHEKPDVPNFGNRGSGKKIKNGMVLAIEPMINMGTKNVKQLNDGWTIVTSDGKPSAHFEHNVAVIDGKTEILSTFEYVEEALQAVHR
ncbi:MAG: type I methionyl aminopeptidase [Bacteroidia bacterium]|nr:type I methionyl aminopeptidase [Bacteroidia bacterium]